MSGKLRLNGATSGYSELQAPDVAGDQTFTLPATGGELATKSGGGVVVGYQQGEWTPVPSLGTITTQSCTWSRIGNRVFIEGSVTGFSDSTSTNAIELAGMPYPRIATYQAQGTVRTRYINFDDYITCSITGTSVIRFYSVNTAGVTNTLSYGSIVTANKADGQFIFSLSYLTDDTTWVPINGATLS